MNWLHITFANVEFCHMFYERVKNAVIYRFQFAGLPNTQQYLFVDTFYTFLFVY